MSATVVGSEVDAEVRGAMRRREERRDRQGDGDCFLGIILALELLWWFTNPSSVFEAPKLKVELKLQNTTLPSEPS